MATNNNINYGPAALPGTVPTPVLGNNIDRAPAPVAPGAGTGYVPTVTQPVRPVTEQPVINPPIVVARTAVVIPVVEQPVATVVAESTTGPDIAVSNQQRYITILANGAVITSDASSLDFEGSGFTITSSGVNGAVISINAEAGGYGNSNVTTLLAAFGSNTLSTTGNVTGGYILGNGSQLTGIAANYGNANVVANLAALGSNPVSTTGNVTGGNLLTSGAVSFTGGSRLRPLGANLDIFAGAGSYVQLVNSDESSSMGVDGAGCYITTPGGSWGFSTTGTFSAPGNFSAVGNVTGGNLRTGGIISATGNITGGNILGGANVNATTHTGTTVSVSANVTGGNITTAGLIVTTGNVSGGNVIAATLVQSATVSASGNVTGGNILTGGLISATGNITGGNILGGANVNATTHTGTTVSVTANITGGNILTGGLISATGNITGGNIQGTIGDILNVNSTNLTVTNILAPSSGNVLNIGAGGNNNLVVSNVLVQIQNVPLSVNGNITGGNVGTGIITLTNGAVIKDTSGDSVVFGQNAGLTSQAQHAVAIGINAGRLYQGEDSVAIGYNAGYYDQGRGVAIGWNAGEGGVLFRSVSDAQGGSGPVRNYVSGDGNPTLTLDSVVNVTVNDLVFGNNIPAGAYVVSIASPNINISAPPTAALTAGDLITFVGLTLGINDASNIVLYMRVIGTDIPANTFVQSTGCSVVTLNNRPTAPLVNGASITFNVGQGFGATAVGYRAGENFQDANAVAVGSQAGYDNQGVAAVAIGYLAGYANQGNAAVAMGWSAGQTTQGTAAVAIGEDAGRTNQGEYSVAIGYQAGYSGQGNNSIVLNATGDQINGITANTFTVTPVRNDVANTANVMFYNASSKEITYGDVISVAGNITGGNVLFGSGIVSGTGNITGGNLTISGNTATITTANYSIGYLNVPQISLAANTTIALTDSGKHYYSVSASNLALTIANNTSVSWPIGTAISIVNANTANILINQGTGVSLYLAGNATAGNRVLATFGMATIMNTAANVWFINGTGLT
jgi:hypothetical protein